MKRIISYTVALTMLSVSLSPNLAEAVSVRKRNYYSLENRSQIEVRFGVRNDTHDLNDFYTDPALSRSGLGDAFVSFGYNYFADERTAFSLSLKVLAAEEIDYLDFAGGYTEEYSVVPIFVGMRHYLTAPGLRSPVRPYITLQAGPVFGSQRFLYYGLYDDTDTYTAVGAHFGGGIDMQAGRHFMIGINAGYNLMSDFDIELGDKDNYSGAEFGVGFGFVF
ncbi:MAG: hypothetical protein AB1483_09655 [Candidatus Zixiibacteriota bacterium]